MQPLVGHKSELKDIAVGVRMSCYGWDYAWEDALKGSLVGQVFPLVWRGGGSYSCLEGNQYSKFKRMVVS
jgi:hypothetical protein